MMPAFFLCAMRDYMIGWSYLMLLPVEAACNAIEDELDRLGG
ncbi:hypothetical protein [Bradyrhizobium sp. 139]|nr:hypothetical protein [Bradyrhizobium sp. 139]